jgi:hypothetical protein
LQGDEAREGKDTITTLEKVWLLKRTLTPLQVAVAIDQASGCGFIKTVPAEKKKKCDSAVDEACGLLRAVKKMGKK